MNAREVVEKKVERDEHMQTGQSEHAQLASPLKSGQSMGDDQDVRPDEQQWTSEQTVGSEEGASWMPRRSPDMDFSESVVKVALGDADDERGNKPEKVPREGSILPLLDKDRDMIVKIHLSALRATIERYGLDLEIRDADDCNRAELCTCKVLGVSLTEKAPKHSAWTNVDLISTRWDDGATGTEIKRMLECSNLCARTLIFFQRPCLLK